VGFPQGSVLGPVLFIFFIKNTDKDSSHSSLLQHEVALIGDSSPQAAST